MSCRPILVGPRPVSGALTLPLASGVSDAGWPSTSSANWPGSTATPAAPDQVPTRWCQRPSSTRCGVVTPIPALSLSAMKKGVPAPRPKKLSPSVRLRPGPPLGEPPRSWTMARLTPPSVVWTQASSL